MTDHSGQRLGNYQILRLLGQGSFAVVYLGEHIYLHTRAAIKILHERLYHHDVEKFLTEARTIANLIHPNIVRILDFDVQENTPFLIMDYAPDGSLQTLSRQGIPLAPTIILPYVKQIAAALQYAHNRKLIHRDVKPQNMLLSPQKEVWLSDFGLALPASTTGSLITQDTAGSPAYMAPEQFIGKPYPASDQYALGIVLYEWLCGKRPFSGNAGELYTKHTFVPPVPLREHVPAIPLAVEEVVMRALAKDRHQRFANVRTFADAFEHAIRPLPSLYEQLPTFSMAVEHPLSIVPSFPGDPALTRHPVVQMDVKNSKTTKSSRKPVLLVSPPTIEKSYPIIQPIGGLLHLPIITLTDSTSSRQEQPSARSPHPPSTKFLQSPQRKRLSRRTSALLLVLTLLVLGSGGGLHTSVSRSIIQIQVKNQKITLTPTLTAPGASVTPTTIMNGTTVLAKDTFQRAAQVFWGTASDGRLWGGDANSIEVFSIVNGAGQVDHAQGTFNAVLGGLNTNAEVLMSASVNQFVAGGQVNVGAVLRWKDANTWYKALIDGTHLQLLSRVNGVTTSLALVPFQARGGVTYKLRFRALGANLFARAWQSGQPEPATWMLTVANTALTQGMGGVRVLVQTATIVRVTSFLETNIMPAA